MTVEELKLKKEEEIITNEIWEMGKKKNPTKDELLWDGVVSVEEYLNKDNKYKIMWMLKEPHCVSGFKLGTDLLDQEERTRVIQKEKYNPTLYGMTYVTYGLLNDKCFEEMNEPKTDFEMSVLKPNPEMSEVLTRIAWVNISKASGEPESEKENLKNEYGFWKEILFKQIKTYSPDILIFGGTFRFFENDWKKYFEISPHGNHFFQDNMLVISTYHPAYPYYDDAKVTLKDYVNKIIEIVKAEKRKE
jgi:hypothetical protein